MLGKISEEELDFFEDMCDPICSAECLFDDFDNLRSFDEEKFGHVRFGQFPLLSHEYVIDDENPNLVPDGTASEREVENFRQREMSGSIYCFGARKFGKSLIVEKVDMMVSIPNLDSEHIGFTSYDALHIQGIMEPVALAIENHPFIKIFLSGRIKRSPNYRINLKTGSLIESLNMNLNSKSPGGAFYQKHLHRLYIEEASQEPKSVYDKRAESVSELGCVIRSAGMTDFTRFKPAGLAFYEDDNKQWICNLAQYVNPRWDEKLNQKSIKKYGGANSINYRIFVKGEVVEDGVSVFDIERVKKCYLEEKNIKTFEITKDSFTFFRDDLVVERPLNADRIWITADIGETAPTEIVIMSSVNDTYRYLYNVTLYNLTDKQQYQIFKWLVKTLEADILGIECGDGTGRAIYRRLEEVLPKEMLVWYAGTLKIVVGFEENEKGKVIFKNGKPVEKEEFMSEWSVKRLKDLLYAEKMVIPQDHKFKKQINSVIATRSGNRTIYNVSSEESHLFDAFKVFTIAEWEHGANLRKTSKANFCKVGV